MVKQRKKRKNAYGILQLALSESSYVEQYFRKDLSPLIYEAAGDEKPEGACPAARIDDTLGRAFHRLLRVRSLARGEKQLYGGQRHIALGSYTGQGGELLRQRGTPVSHHEKNKLKEGRKHSRLEDGFGSPGISGVLLPVSSRLLYLTLNEEARLINLLSSDEFNALRELAFDLGPKIDYYQDWYEGL